ncbi:phosphatase PAP2 family protein [Ponticaulis profundi]|uniref:Phosphatase PAP2 family protein n=1 Tax=Ponticaulis profundi TaxID=2665222 RepID=A0ABW1S753_9PROT
MISELWHQLRARLPIAPSLILVFGVIAASFMLFWSLAEEILEGEGHEFDEWLFLVLRNPSDTSDPIGPGWFEYAVADITALGGYAILTLLLTAAATYLIAIKRWRHAAILIGAVLSGTALSSLLKLGIARPRPDLVEHMTHAMSSSFPSGHATLSATAYLTIGLILAEAHEKKRIRGLIMMFAVITTMLVGMSRVYLGVHWPSDVLAGWALGTSWALLWWVLLRWWLSPGDGPIRAFRSDRPQPEKDDATER